MASHTITPHAAKQWRRRLRAETAILRADLRKVRALRESGRFIDLEDADSLLEWVLIRRSEINERRRWLTTVEVKKYAAISPAAAVRLYGVAA